MLFSTHGPNLISQKPRKDRKDRTLPSRWRGSAEKVNTQSFLGSWAVQVGRDFLLSSSSCWNAHCHVTGEPQIQGWLRKGPCTTQTSQGHSGHSPRWLMVGNVSCDLEGAALSGFTHPSQRKKSSLEKLSLANPAPPLALPWDLCASKLGVYRGSTKLAQLCIYVGPSSACFHCGMSTCSQI